MAAMPAIFSHNNRYLLDLLVTECHSVMMAGHFESTSYFFLTPRRGHNSISMGCLWRPSTVNAMHMQRKRNANATRISSNGGHSTKPYQRFFFARGVMSLCHWYLDVVFANQTVSSHIYSSSSFSSEWYQQYQVVFVCIRVRWLFPSKKNNSICLLSESLNLCLCLQCSCFIDGLCGHCVQNPELVNHLISIFSIGELFQRFLILEVADWILSPLPLGIIMPFQLELSTKY